MFESGLEFLRADFHLHTQKDKEFSYSGEPNDFSRTTLRPLGPNVTFTVSAKTSTPRTIAERASDENLISFAISLTSFFSYSTIARMFAVPTMV